MNAMSDELALELTGYRPSDLSERDESLIRERARLRWAKLLAVANGHKTVDPVAYLVDWADIGEGAAQSLYYGDFAKQHMEDAVRYAADARQRSAKVTPLYAEPASALASRSEAPTAQDAELLISAYRIAATLQGEQSLVVMELANRFARLAGKSAEKSELLTALRAVYEACDGYVPNTSKSVWAAAYRAIAKETGDAQ